ncbi:MAG: hypothetical protein KJP00_00310 [Bacteroidia bacterium]|nr:hypothetical protein [Bacteroidia bacterium]
MPGIEHHTILSDKDIADLLVFLRNSFSFSDTDITKEDVGEWREQLTDNEELFTEEDLHKIQNTDQSMVWIDS